jgi:hypothetical protein
MPESALIVTAPAPAAKTAVAPASAPSAKHGGFFDDLLSELNPLQYVPVVGTIYRAVTGDTISEDARFAGSLVVSGLTGGPVGIAMNVGITALEHLFGIDPEKIGDDLLADIGIGGGPAAPAAPATSTSTSTVTVSAAPPAAEASAPTPVASTVGGWSAAKLSAYGVQRTANGDLTCGTVSGADVLNNLELARIAQPA